MEEIVEQPKENIRVASFDLEDLRGNTLNIIMVWAKRFCRDSSTINLILTEKTLEMNTTSIEALLDFSIMMNNIKINKFPRNLPLV
jgi:hypothetical protein